MLIVYGSLVSPFVRKVLATAAEKGIEVDNRPGGFAQGGDAFAEASPFGKIPAMRDPGAGADGADFTLYDSTAIVAYLDAKHPAPRLIPEDPRACGQAIAFEEFADTILMAAGGKMFFNRVVAPLFLGRPGDEAAAASAEADELPPLLKWLDAQCAGRDFLVGDSLTIADIAVAAPFANLDAMGKAIDPAAYPEAARWLAGITARPSIGPAYAAVGKMVAKAQERAAATA